MLQLDGRSQQHVPRTSDASRAIANIGGLSPHSQQPQPELRGHDDSHRILVEAGQPKHLGIVVKITPLARRRLHRVDPESPPSPPGGSVVDVDEGFLTGRGRFFAAFLTVERAG